MARFEMTPDQAGLLMSQMPAEFTGLDSPVSYDGAALVADGAAADAIAGLLLTGFEELAAARLPQVKAELKAAIDRAAEAERLKYVTAGAGQAMEYQQAANEAVALLEAMVNDAEHVPDAADYPMLAASVGIDGADLAEVAATVAIMHQQWQAIGSAIRATRLAAKAAIDAAEDEAAARAISIAWPAPG